ncbi:MAG: hypothetical protein CMN76_00350 [Spirochaetaceae bacterium]|nr:hypothetical protein [Spirochaetaceae bacterium]
MYLSWGRARFRSTWMKWLTSIILALVVSIPVSLEAQFVCEGTACAALPLNQAQLDRIYNDIQFQYFDQVFEDMAEAAALASLSGAPMGDINLDSFTFGLSAAVSYRALEEVDVRVAEVGTVENLPSTGVAAQPRVYLGMNLGEVMGGTHLVTKTPPWYSLSRFDLYISYVTFDMDQPSGTARSDSEDWNVNARSKGLELRYHLADRRELTGPMMQFLGVSLGLGYNRFEQDIRYSKQNTGTRISLASGEAVRWDANDTIQYRSFIESYPLDIRTGVQFFHFLNLTVGAGSAWTKGHADFTASRAGPAYLESDIAALLGITIPPSSLILNVTGSGAPPARFSYGLVGVELNFYFWKLYVEARGNENVYSANVGLRAVF